MVEKTIEETKKEVAEPATGEEEIHQDLTKMVVDLQDGVPSDVIESLCMECGKNGETRFMYTKIPMFKEIILSSFSCEHCGNKNTEVQFGGKLEKQGIHFRFKCTEETSLNRSCVKSEFATIRIPELGFEIPPQTQKGSINTIEVFFQNSIDGLDMMQAERRKYDPMNALKIGQFINQLRSYKDGEVLPFTFEIIDPSGNSFIQNPNAPNVDPNLDIKHFDRSLEDYATMGYNVDEARESIKAEAAQKSKDRNNVELLIK